MPVPFSDTDTASSSTLKVSDVTSDRNDIVSNGDKIPNGNAVFQKLVNSYMTVEEIGANYALINGLSSNNFAANTLTAASVNTPEVASTTSLIDVGSGVNRRIRIEDKSSGSNSEVEIRPIRTAAGVLSGVQNINSHIQFFAQSGASDMTLFSQSNRKI